MTTDETNSTGVIDESDFQIYQLNERLLQRNAELEKELSDLSEQNAVLVMQLSEIDVLQGTINELQLKCQHLTQEAEKQKSKASVVNAQAEEASRHLDNLTKENESLKASLAALEEKFDEQKRQHEKQDQDIVKQCAQKDAEIISLKEEIDELKKELESAQSKVTDSEKKLSGFKRAYITRASAELPAIKPAASILERFQDDLSTIIGATAKAVLRIIVQKNNLTLATADNADPAVIKNIFKELKAPALRLCKQEDQKNQIIKLLDKYSSEIDSSKTDNHVSPAPEPTSAASPSAPTAASFLSNIEEKFNSALKNAALSSSKKPASHPAPSLPKTQVPIFSNLQAKSEKAATAEPAAKPAPEKTDAPKEAKPEKPVLNKQDKPKNFQEPKSSPEHKLSSEQKNTESFNELASKISSAMRDTSAHKTAAAPREETAAPDKNDAHPSQEQAKASASKNETIKDGKANEMPANAKGKIPKNARPDKTEPAQNKTPAKEQHENKPKNSGLLDFNFDDIKKGTAKHPYICGLKDASTFESILAKKVPTNPAQQFVYHAIWEPVKIASADREYFRPEEAAIALSFPKKAENPNLLKVQDWLESLAVNETLKPNSVPIAIDDGEIPEYDKLFKIITKINQALFKIQKLQIRMTASGYQTQASEFDSNPGIAVNTDITCLPDIQQLFIIYRELFSASRRRYRIPYILTNAENLCEVGADLLKRTVTSVIENGNELPPEILGEASSLWGEETPEELCELAKKCCEVSDNMNFQFIAEMMTSHPWKTACDTESDLFALLMTNFFDAGLATVFETAGVELYNQCLEEGLCKALASGNEPLKNRIIRLALRAETLDH